MVGQKMALALCFALRSQVALGAAQDVAHLRAAPGPRYDGSLVRRLEDSLTDKPSTITCNSTSGLPLTCRSDAVCCGAPTRQICCGPGSVCAGNENAPVCALETTCAGSAMVCDGFSGPLCGGPGSRCCGDAGHQVVCAPGFQCVGTDTAPQCIQAGSVICNGTSGLPLTCAPGAICCGAPTRQICCAPGSLCAGNEQAPVCEAATTCAGSPIRCSGFSGFLCGGEGARCCGSPGNAIVCGDGFECSGTDTAPGCVASPTRP